VVDPKRPIGVYYEHPRWFEPVFAEMDRRGIPYVRLDAARHRFPIASNGNHPAQLAEPPQAQAGLPVPPKDDQQFGLIFNRMSPSAWTRGNAHAIFYTLSYLAHLERMGVRVVNGSEGFRNETSKALQLSLLETLGLPYPRSVVINHPSQAADAARGMRFPVVIKPNIGGSGVGIVRFDSREEIEAAAREDKLQFGLDGTGIVQEFIPARGGHITRVETLGYKYLYGIKVFTAGDTFDLCPMDICKTTDGAKIETACVVEGPKTGLRVEGYRPPDEVIAAVERIFSAAKVEVGGVEYIIDDRDGQLYYYDINALSNFVSDGPRVVGFNPFERLVDYLVAEAR
jgi:hypothetical protein